MIHFRKKVLASVDVHGLSTMLVAAFSDIQATSHVRTGRADLHARVIDLWKFVLPGIVPAERISRFDPAGSPECRSELGLPAPDSAPATTA
ncbi:hypothetical protein ACODT5_15150 [Streptomyces sp. 5.8]|uniref:hypothetical protein n=1 Tax=Streptomyces sp. 5.8 TaxID=3406571 RepID=UPI003BB4A06C